MRCNCYFEHHIPDPFGEKTITHPLNQKCFHMLYPDSISESTTYFPTSLRRPKINSDCYNILFCLKASNDGTRCVSGGSEDSKGFSHLPYSQTARQFDVVQTQASYCYRFLKIRNIKNIFVSGYQHTSMYNRCFKNV